MYSRAICFVFVLVGLVSNQAALTAQSPQTDRQPNRLDVPLPDLGLVQIEARAAEQIESIASARVFSDFRFEDRQSQSGISFLHRITEDGAKYFKMVHYDHGNGVAVADVDGDGLLDVFLVSQTGRNELWRNLGEGRFEDITERSGTGLADRISVAPAFADYDNDGDPDLFVSTVRMGNVMFENLGGGKFRDRSRQLGLDHVGHSSAGVFFDYDRDGWLDLFVTNVGSYTIDQQGPGPYFIGREDAFSGHLHQERSERSLLYHNEKGRRFRDVTTETGLLDSGFSGDAVFAYVNGDDYPDLYVLNMQGDDHLWENRGGKSFVAATERYFPKTPWGAMGAKFFDYDNDGRSDLYLTDMHSDMSLEVPPASEYDKALMMWDEDHLQGGGNNIFGNALYRHTETGAWEEVSDKTRTENYWPWGPSIGDLNADGWLDIFVASSMSYPFRYGINSVMLNDHGERFVHAEFKLGVEPRQVGHNKVPWFTVDCSSEADKSTERLQRICGQRRGIQEVWANLGTRSAVIFDLDEDGDLDIITSEFNARPQVLVSNLAQKRQVRALKLRLQGSRSNRDGLGARVTVTSGEVSWTQVHDGKTGYLAQSSTYLYFALPSGSADQVEIIWPSGQHQLVREGLRSGSPIVIREP